MLIVYGSYSGNVRRFVKKTGLRAVEITNDLTVNEPFILVTYTTGFGSVPDRVTTFLEKDDNHAMMWGVAASGNMNWGEALYAKSADLVSQTYGVPVLLKFEMAGKQSEVDKFIQEVSTFETHRTQ